ncbi:TIGR02302 family protein [Litorivita pollutaquae]|uniref:TIGR02302 family protein n=1 Tax=Litorivita pollutaquae TaxID=2200892 RepID=A0A2V4MUB8_9RHOB|nr:TIGR02302 family protein [Litorivita pollutaquae]PYC47818.1 TIGR02302 family protein [Litorivita pollutaquae]
MSGAKPPLDTALKALRWPLALTRAGLFAERGAKAFWPLWSVLVAALGALMLGLHEVLPVEVVWALTVLAVLGALWFAGRGALRFRFPTRAEALARLDASLAGRPLQALADRPAMAADAASAALWAAHQSRMAERTKGVKPVPGDVRLSRRDPFGLRYVALLLLLLGLLFGSFWRVRSVAGMGPGGGAALASGPTWEGWLAPPPYTGLPVLYLPDIPAGTMKAPQGSRITLRFYGEVGALSLSETVSKRRDAVPAASDPAQEFTVGQSGELAINGAGGRIWDIDVTPDTAPQVRITAPADVSMRGETTLPFEAADDYGVISGRAVIALDLEALNRRYGLAATPEPRAPIEAQLPMPITGNRAAFEENLIENYSKHAWANLPVRVTLYATDAVGQEGASDAAAMRLSARRFFDPLAAAVIELRRDLLWTRVNAPRTAQLLRAMSYEPEGLFRDDGDYLQLRMILRRLEAALVAGELEDDARDEIAEAMWALALQLEEGDLEDARARMKRAQDRLSEAMKRGASENEIAELMQELRDATADYMRQLAREQNEQSEAPQSAQNGGSMQMTQNDLQKMMDRIQELMEQGRMAEAQQALAELQELLENMRIAQGQGQGMQSPGAQAMDGLSDTLRDQQSLSDQAFRDLQDQFNPGQQQGQQGQTGESGQSDQPGENGQGGEGQSGQAGNGGSGGMGQEGQGGSQDLAENLSDRQRSLRQELSRQRSNLPQAGTEGGEAAREALDRAGEAMEGAEEALREGDLAEAINRQAEAMDGLRDGIRNLGEAMAESSGAGERGQQQAQGEGQGGQSGGRDPLGRMQGSTSSDADGGRGYDPDAYGQALELLDDLRRRAGELSRPEKERDYFKRLLERF